MTADTISPTESADQLALFDTGKRSPKARQLFLGTQGFSYPWWVGDFYPAGTQRRDFLSAYARIFGWVEIDAPFHAPLSPDNVRRWRQVTPADFRISLKFESRITHELRLVDAGEATKAFLDSVALLGDKAGPLLLQLPPGFHSGYRKPFEQFLSSLPKDFRYAVEVRHASWMQDWFFELLTKHSIAYVLAARPNMPSETRATAHFTYIRLMGPPGVTAVREGEPLINRDEELDKWCRLVEDRVSIGLTVFCSVNDIYQGFAPATIRELQKRLSHLLN